MLAVTQLERTNLLVRVIRAVVVSITAPVYWETSPANSTLEIDSLVADSFRETRDFVRSVLAVFLSVALPVLVDALPVATLELGVFTLATRALISLLVTSVPAVVLEVAAPVVRNALPVAAPELAGALTVGVHVAASLVTAVPAVIVPVTSPQLGDTELVATLPLVCRAVLDRGRVKIFSSHRAGSHLPSHCRSR